MWFLGASNSQPKARQKWEMGNKYPQLHSLFPSDALTKQKGNLSSGQIQRKPEGTTAHAGWPSGARETIEEIRPTKLLGISQ